VGDIIVPFREPAQLFYLELSAHNLTRIKIQPTANDDARNAGIPAVPNKFQKIWPMMVPFWFWFPSLFYTNPIKDF